MTSDKWQEDLRYLAMELPKRHYNLFHRISREEFEQAVSVLDKKIASLSDHEVAVELGRIVAMVGGGHTEISLTRPVPGFSMFPLALYFFGDSLYVIAASQQYTKALGTRVLKIGDMIIDAAYKAVKPLLAHDNDIEFIDAAPRYLVFAEILHALKVIPQKESANFFFQAPSGEIFSMELQPIPYQQTRSIDWTFAQGLSGNHTPLYLQNQEEHYWFIYLEDSNTLYFNYDVCNNQKGKPSIKAFAKEMFEFVDSHSVDRFVVDLRHNSGGNFHRSEPIIDGISKRPAINKSGTLFVIIGRRTYSAGLVTAIELKKKTEAIFVGEPSRGKPNGQEDVKHFRLPNSRIEVDYATKRHLLIPELGDAPYFPIEIPVKLSIQDYLSGRDPVLETILSFQKE